ncbi:MAG: CAP domain-containing protein, partial [Myxococcota bacterium]|nr:CAP domain-containing protein [Myxococcota bacterium]
SLSLSLRHRRTFMTLTPGHALPLLLLGLMTLLTACADGGATGSTSVTTTVCCQVGADSMMVIESDCDEDNVLARASCDLEPGPYTGDVCVPWTYIAAPADFEERCNPEGAFDIAALEASMVAMINADRVEHAEEANQAEPVGLECAISEVARLHSYEMCRTGEFEHVLGGRNARARIEDGLGWELGDDYTTVGENIAYSFDLQRAEDAFVEEEPPCDEVLGGHRLNILNRNFRYVGLGYCQCAGDEYDNFYITQNFVTYDPDLVTDGNPYCEAFRAP